MVKFSCCDDYLVMKKIVFGLCIALGSIVSHAETVTKSSCEHLMNAAEGVMKLRQNGTQYEQLKQQVTHIDDSKQKDLFLKLVNDAFAVPAVNDEQQKKVVIQNFASKYKGMCSES
ncbi:hypothetical protein P256_00313 [Acinetobacter nectaris CIP 110549]|uniref:Uncharacterized protein n=2 Tax=Acinetobacter nectaris TaxID=1219382 RepID=V2TGS2_9GAMM|nr:hypothetical protein P256_00313 [Acinetobacter nectaris CIP 110549]